MPGGGGGVQLVNPYFTRSHVPVQRYWTFQYCKYDKYREQNIEEI